MLADWSLCIGSGRSFYWALHSYEGAQRLGWPRPPQEPRAVPRLRGAGPNQAWNRDITYLPRADSKSVPGTLAEAVSIG